MLRLWERISSGEELLRFLGRKLRLKRWGLGRITSWGELYRSLLFSSHLLSLFNTFFWLKRQSQRS